jgi:hypothetical protein
LISNQHQEWRDRIRVAPYRDIEPELQSENTPLLVEAGSDLVEAALIVANNEKLTLTRLIEAGKLRRPGFRELDTWRASELPLRFLVSPPYVLLQLPLDS